uniref:Uncharacterized protein n=1 Tax=Oryza brachyantha TaxID=4533 RepID=J3MJ06_ORYBR
MRGVCVARSDGPQEEGGVEEEWRHNKRRKRRGQRRLELCGSWRWRSRLHSSLSTTERR